VISRVVKRVFVTMFAMFLPLLAIEPDFKKFDGSGVILDLNSSKRTVFGSRENERLSPCSTFKILNSMIALESKVIKNENEIIKWDGVMREYPQWNQDHSMRSAIAVSAVWFYQELARRIGEEKMQKKLLELNFGNKDISQGLTTFWLGGGSLKISLNEQVDFLSKLLRNELPFSKETQERVKDIITLQKNDNFLIAGKTGSCDGIGWFVGFTKDGKKTEVFAFNIKGEDASGLEAKRIAFEYIKNR
jgi:beta-lactamase class D